MVTGVILAAGRGSRLAAPARSKPLCPVRGRALIDWVMLSSRDAGIEDFVVVTGYGRDAVERHVSVVAERLHTRVRFAFNDHWHRDNGISVLRAKGLVGDTFILLMADHIFDPGILAALMANCPEPGGLVLAADFRVPRHPWVDLDDVTRLFVEDGRISRIGKQLQPYNAFDTGIFHCTPALFEAIAESDRHGDASLSGGVRLLAGQGRARVMDIGSRIWVDVDDADSRAHAERLLAEGPLPIVGTGPPHAAEVATSPDEDRIAAASPVRALR